jgi:hypothetical protein
MRRLLTASLILAAAGPAAADDYPKVELKVKHTKVTVYLPDAGKGYYRGSRFDWSGVAGHWELGDPKDVDHHKLFTPWKDKHDPTNHDDILGPVEEFGMDKPLGYDEAKVGETFLKIGVGELVKPQEDGYRFYHNYKIARPGSWKVERDGGEAIRFLQEVKTPGGYGYRYEKGVRLYPPNLPFRYIGGPAIQIGHRLKNTGDKPIVTDVYNHNFLNIDNDPIGPNYRFTLQFPVAAPEPKERFKELVELNGKELRFKKPLDTGSVFASLAGFDRDCKAGFTLHHAKTEWALRVFGPAPDQPLSKFNFWAVKTAACPEPFLSINLKPGKEVEWVWGYLIEP